MPIGEDGYYRRASRRQRARGARVSSRGAGEGLDGYTYKHDPVPESPARSARLIDLDDDGDQGDDPRGYSRAENPYEAALAPLKFANTPEEEAKATRSRRSTRHVEPPSPHDIDNGLEDQESVPSRSAPRRNGVRSSTSVRPASYLARRAARASAVEPSVDSAPSPTGPSDARTYSERDNGSPLARQPRLSLSPEDEKRVNRNLRPRQWEAHPEDEPEDLLPDEEHHLTNEEQYAHESLHGSGKATLRPLPPHSDDEPSEEEAPRVPGSGMVAQRALSPRSDEQSLPESISRADATGIPAYEEDEDRTERGAGTPSTWSSVEAPAPARAPAATTQRSPRAVPEPSRAAVKASSAARSRGKPVSPAPPVQDIAALAKDDGPDEINLTPQQRHYLVRALVALQLGHEMGELEKLGTLTVYGLPFSPLRPPVGKVGKDLINEYTKDLPVVPAAEDPYATDGLVAGKRADDAVVRRTERITQPVILRHLFHTHFRTFPGLDTAPSKFWQQRVQVLLDEVAARNLSTSLERSELTQRRVWALAMVDGLGKFFARGIGIRGEDELRGPGPGIKGTAEWGVGKQWGKGTVKRGLDKPVTLSSEMLDEIDALFAPGTKSNASGDAALEDAVDAQWRLAGERARQEKKDAQALKETLIEQEDGLEKLWDLFLAASRVTELPPRLQRAWAHFRQLLANALYEVLVLSPEAEQLVKKLKSAHALFPYWGAKQLLRYNHHPPHVMVQSLLSLLLARPAASEKTEGDKAQSLLQRILGFILTREMDQIKDTLIRPLRSSLGQAAQSALANRLVDYVTYADRVERATIERKTLETGDDVITTILLESPALGHGPDEERARKLLKPVDADQVLAMQRAFALSPWRGHIDAAYPPEASRYDEAIVEDAEEAFHDARPPAEVPEEEAEKWALTEEEEDMAYDFAQLKLLLRETHRVRDREELLDVVMGPLLPTMVKDLLEYVFYDGLRAATSAKVDLSRALGDVKEFIDDLLAVRQRSVAHPDECGPAEWVSLLMRHEDHLLGFMHDLAPVAEPLLEWVQLGTDYLALSTSDPAHPADRTQPNIEINVDTLLADERIKPEDRKRILREVDALASWSMWQKVRQELEARRELLFALPPDPLEDEGRANQAQSKGKGKGRAYTPDEGMDELGVDNLPPDPAFIKAASDVDRLLYRLMRRNGVTVDDGLCRTEARGTETQTYPALWFDELDPTGQQIMAEEQVKELRYVPLRTDFPPPHMLHTRRLLPAFRHQISAALPDWTAPRRVQPEEPPKKSSNDSRSQHSDPGRPRPRVGERPDPRPVRGERSMSIQSELPPGRDYLRPPRGPYSDDGGLRPQHPYPSPDRHSLAHLPPLHEREPPPKKKLGNFAATLVRGLSLSHPKDSEREKEAWDLSREGPRDRFPSDQGRPPLQGRRRSSRDDPRRDPYYPAEPRQHSYFPEAPPRREEREEPPRRDPYAAPPRGPYRDGPPPPRREPYGDSRGLTRTESGGPPPRLAGWERGPSPPRGWDDRDDRRIGGEPRGSSWADPGAGDRFNGRGPRRPDPRDWREQERHLAPRDPREEWDLPSPKTPAQGKGLKISSFFR